MLNLITDAQDLELYEANQGSRYGLVVINPPADALLQVEHPEDLGNWHTIKTLAINSDGVIEAEFPVLFSRCRIHYAAAPGGDYLITMTEIHESGL